MHVREPSNPYVYYRNIIAVYDSHQDLQLGPVGEKCLGYIASTSHLVVPFCIVVRTVALYKKLVLCPVAVIFILEPFHGHSNFVDSIIGCLVDLHCSLILIDHLTIERLRTTVCILEARPRAWSRS